MNKQNARWEVLSHKERKWLRGRPGDEETEEWFILSEMAQMEVPSHWAERNIWIISLDFNFKSSNDDETNSNTGPS